MLCRNGKIIIMSPLNLGRFCCNKWHKILPFFILQHEMVLISPLHSLQGSTISCKRANHSSNALTSVWWFSVEWSRPCQAVSGKLLAVVCVNVVPDHTLTQSITVFERLWVSILANRSLGYLYLYKGPLLCTYMEKKTGIVVMQC